MSELIHQFGIDWRLMFAQAVNFLILLFILWRFAYRPVLAILAERRLKIVEGLKMREDAEKRLSRAEEERELMIKKAEQESLALINRGELFGKERAERIISEAMKKSEDIILEGRVRAEEASRIAAEEFSKEAADLIKAAAAKVVERSSEEIDGRLVDEALSELRRVSAAVK